MIKFGYLDPSYRKWQIYFMFKRCPWMPYAHDLAFGCVKVISYPERGALAVHGKEWKGFSIMVRIMHENTGIWWHGGRGMRRIIPIPAIKFHRGI